MHHGGMAVCTQGMQKNARAMQRTAQTRDR